MTRERLICLLKAAPDDTRIVLATGTPQRPVYSWLRDAVVEHVPMGEGECIVLTSWGGKETGGGVNGRTQSQ